MFFKKIWIKLKLWFAKRKARKLAEQGALDELQKRAADIAKKLNSPILNDDPDTRKALQEELKEVSSAMERLEKTRTSRKAGSWWVLQTFVSLFVTGVIMALTIFLPALNNKYADKFQRLYDKLVRR
jgi:hypothetical protein